MSKNIVVVATHPDDETLGCGGTLLKHKENGDNIYWIIVTSLKSNHKLYEKREKEIEVVQNLYGFDEVYRCGFDTTYLDAYDRVEIVSKFSNLFSKLQPHTVYLPFCNDTHSDHRIVFECAYSCTKSFRYPSIKRVLMMETLSETEFSPALTSQTFVPNFYIDISDYIDRKITIIKTYESEIKDHPFPRSIEAIKAQAILRGSRVGVKYAESFMLLKAIE